MIKKDLSKEIQQYYKFSKFINKYFIVIGSFILSVFGVFALNQNDIRILDYSNSDILKSFPTKAYIGLNFDIFNKSSKDISAQLIFSKYEINKGSYKLGYGIYKLKDTDIYLPSNIKLVKKYIINAKKPSGYYRILEKAVITKPDFKFPKLNILDDTEVIKIYNLSCIDGILNNSLFCEYNKKHLLYDLFYKKIDLNASMYLKLFLSLNETKKTKCTLLKKIYSKKYNFKHLLPSIKKFCNLEIEDFKLADEFINKVVRSNNIFLSKNSPYIEVTKSILANQWIKLVKNKTIPSEDLINHIKFIKELIISDLIDSKIASIEYIILKKINDKIKSNSDYYKLKEKIILLKNGEKDIFPGLNSFINDFDKFKKEDIDNVVVVKDDLRSTREKIKNIFEEKYSRLFIFTDKVRYDINTKKTYVKGYLKISFDDKKIKKQIPMEFEVYNLVGSKFKIKNVKILDPKLQNYIDSIGINLNNLSFIELYHLLLDKLYAPLVNNDWGSNQEDICANYKILMKNKQFGTCKNGVISLNYANLLKKTTTNFNIYLKLDDTLSVVDIKITPNKLEEIVKTSYGEDKILIPLKVEEKYIKGKLPLSISKVFKLIPIVYNKLKENELKKKIKLTQDELKQLQEEIKIYLNSNLDLVRFVKGNLYKLYFVLKGYKFIAYYDKKNNEILHLIMLIGDKKLILKNIKLRLSEVNKEVLNGLSIDPISYIKNNYPDKYNEYEQIIKTIKK